MSASLLYVTKFTAKASASLFAGSAFYISYAEHPARMKCDTKTALKQWVPSFKRAAVLQGGLALLTSATSLTTYYYENDKKWLAAGLLALSLWPYTQLALMNINWKLLDPNTDAEATETKSLLEKWGCRHMVRTIIGFIVWDLLNI